MTNNKDFRAGPWAESEREYIRQQAGKMPPEEIALNLRRNEKRVKEFMEKNGYTKYYVGNHQKEEASFTTLTKTPYWKNLCAQFTQEELQTFQYHWQNTAKQFNDDILHTEEMQIIDMIKFEIMMNRLLGKEATINAEIKELNELLDQERMKGDQKDFDAIKHYSIQIDSLYKTTSQIQKEYTDLHNSKTKIFSALKATREQRIKQIENSKESFIDWVKELVKNSELRKSYGTYMEKHRIATQVEYARLSELHTFDDGEVDQPILNSETVI